MQQDGVIAYPTEAVFGLGCLPDSDQAIQRILDIKNRPWHKGLILVASEIQQVEPFIDPEALDLLACFDQYSGQPVTWLLPRVDTMSPLICGRHPKIAIRLSQNPHIRALCDKAGSAIVSTSANRAGQPEMKSPEMIRNHMMTQLDMVVAGPLGGYDRPSKIIDAQTQQVLRD
ncbi:Threonylcarbamoyl-AMP synthase [Kangiella sediminilitoris]|uniref:Threonylcarbamoyl-AMP synthase n=2 Tax=Kangiella sediminilitoris TaxID=1144748 RepID=A0A1B3BE11_9GAMM|nr:Threonylcarbamoyl-AMP synthase [Kangiella sediminilitoris]